MNIWMYMIVGFFFCSIDWQK